MTDANKFTPEKGQYFTVKDRSSNNRFSDTIFKCQGAHKENHVACEIAKPEFVGIRILLDRRDYTFFDGGVDDGRLSPVGE